MDIGDLSGSPVLASVGRAKLIGTAGWIVIFLAFVLWEAVGLMVGHGWPTLSHVTRAATRRPVGRWLLFGAWLWLGWHMFIRGWSFFLRGPMQEGRLLGRSGGFREVLAESFVLAATLLLSIAGLVRRGTESQSETAEGSRPVTFGGLLARVFFVATAAYVVLVGIVGLFVAVAGADPSRLLRGVVGGGAVLAFGVVVPGFLILSLIAAAARRAKHV